MARAEVDITRSQIDPEALAIIEATGALVPPGKTDPAHGDHSPKWAGLSQEWWVRIRAENWPAYLRLIAICEEDFPTFCAVMLKVYNKSISRIHPFIFNNAQRHAWNIMAAMISAGRALFIQLLKARQLGMSTLALAKIDWHTWRERDINNTVIGHTDKLVKTLVRTISLFYDEMPDTPEIKPRLRQGNRNAKVPMAEAHFAQRWGIEWRSSISTHIAKNIETRGDRTTHILESEYAFYPDPKGLNDALMPQLPPIGSPARLLCSCVIESTPNGQNAFYDMWQLAKSGTSEWVAIFLPWYIADDLYSVDPPADWKMTQQERALQKELSRARINEYDGKPVTVAQMYWRRRTIDSKADDVLDAEQTFDMEYPSDDETCFLLYESESLFKKDMKYLGSCISAAEEKIRKIAVNLDFRVQAPITGELQFNRLGSPFLGEHNPEQHAPSFTQRQHGRLHVWEFPQPGHVYTVGSDPGDLSDNAVSHVCCVTCGKQAAELVMHGEGVEAFCDQSIALCRFFNMALWMPEVNHVGTILLKRGMMDWRYANVAREEKWDEPGLKANKFGHYTSESSKPILVSGGKALIADRHYAIASRPLRSEMSTFKNEGNTGLGNPRFKASGSAKDDRVMAMLLALKAVRQSPRMLAMIGEHRHEELPSAVELGLNSTPQFSSRKLDAIPEAMRMYFEDIDDGALSCNPIRGMGLW